MRRIRKVDLVIVIALVLLLLTACVPAVRNPEPIRLGENQNQEVVEWVSINPPPGVEGPCYAYFSREGLVDQSVGFSGVWCSD